MPKFMSDPREMRGPGESSARNASPARPASRTPERGPVRQEREVPQPQMHSTMFGHEPTSPRGKEVPAPRESIFGHAAAPQPPMHEDLLIRLKDMDKQNKHDCEELRAISDQFYPGPEKDLLLQALEDYKEGNKKIEKALRMLK